MKVCSKCGLEKPEDSFSWKYRNGARQAHCRDCAAVYQKDWHLRNCVGRRKQIRDRATLERHDRRLKLIEYLNEHPCVDCGERDPVVLHFDHVRGRKVTEITKMINRAVLWPRILKEIRKCEVRCANCHLRVTAARGNWYKTRKEFQLPDSVTGNTSLSESEN